MSGKKENSNNLFDKFFEHSIDLLCIADTKGNFIKLNPEWEKVLGYPINELEGKPYLDFVHPDDMQATIEAGKELTYNQPIENFVNRYRHKDGSFKWLEWRSFPYDGKIYASVRDITRVKQVEEELKLFKISIDNANDAVYWLNKDGLFEYVNEKACKMLFYTKKELLDLSIFDIDPEITKEIWDKYWENYQIYQGKGSVSMQLESKHRRKDGFEYPVEISLTHFWKDNKEFHIAHIRDISERKEHQEVLKQSEEKYRSLFENMPYSFSIYRILYDKKGVPVNSIYEEVNPASEKLTGLSREQIEGKKIKDIFPDTEDYWIQTFGKVAKTGIPANFTNYSIELNKYFEAFVFSPGKDLCAIILNDVTERKKSEINLINSQKLLSESQRIANIGSWEYIIDKDELNWNEQTYKIYGFDKSIKPNYKISDSLIHPDDRKYVEDKFLDTLKSGIFPEYEYRIIRPDKTLRYIKIVGDIEYGTDNKPKRTYGIIQDITEQKKNEETLRLFKMSIDNSNEAIYWYTPSGDFEYVNKIACKMLGYTQEELLSLSLFDIDKAYSRKQWHTAWKQFQVHKEKGNVSFLYESFHRRKDGTSYPVEITVNHFWLGDKEFHITNVRDVTERKKSELIVREKDLLFRSLIQNLTSASSIYKVITDKNGNPVDYEFIEINPAYEKIVGIKKDTLIGKKLLDVFPRTERVWLDALKQVYITGAPVKVEHYAREVDMYIDLIVYKPKEGLIALIGTDVSERKLQEKAIIESEERARLFVENTPLPIAMFDTNMCYIIASKQWYTIYKVDVPDLTGLNHYDIFPEISDRWKELHQRAIKGEIIKSEKDKFIRQDGTVQWVRYELHPWYKGDNTIGGMVAFTEDITNKVITELALKENELKIQSIFKVVPAGIGLVVNDVLEDVNPKVCEITGYTKEELIGENIRMLYPTDEELKKRNQFAYSPINSNETVEVETLWRRKNGEIINIYLASTPLETNDKSRSVTFTVLDITEKIEAEKQLLIEKERAEETEFFLQESQSTGNIGSYKLDFKTGYWISTETLDKILGVDEGYNKNIEGWLDIIHPEDKQILQKYLQTEVISNHLSFNMEYRIKRKNDNETRWVHGVGKLYYDDSGNLSEMLGTIQDISDRKYIENEIKEINKELEKRVQERTFQLQQANKDLEAFAYSISHDLRAPLRHIDGFLNLMKNAMSSMEPNVKKYFDKIYLSSRGMSVMIDELLKFSRLGRAKINFAPVILTDIVKKIVEQFEPDYKERNIEWKISDLPIVKGDEALLGLAFENLISNAIKYTSKNKHAIIEIGTCEKVEKGACIYIKDNGVGFDIAYKDKLFGVFQRLHKPDDFEGIGVGLANVKQIINKHNGHIDVASEINKGTIFYITLPAG